MGSVMDQERPWERAEKPVETIRERVKYAAEFGLASQLEVIVDELEMLEETYKTIEQRIIALERRSL